MLRTREPQNWDLKLQLKPGQCGSIADIEIRESDNTEIRAGRSVPREQAGGLKIKQKKKATLVFICCPQLTF